MYLKVYSDLSIQFESATSIMFLWTIVNKKKNKNGCVFYFVVLDNHIYGFDKSINFFSDKSMDISFISFDRFSS